MAVHLTGHREGFGPGLTEITRLGEDEHDTGIALSVLEVEPGRSVCERAEGETAWLLMHGEAILDVEGREVWMKRLSLFDERPYCVHVSAGAVVAIEASVRTQFTIYRTANRRRFPAAVFLPSDVREERRGRGVLKNAALRWVRTIFDRANAHRDAELVLGEVVNSPGRWSSYPPHHHPQPEIYHYRFTRPEGYGHAELGEDVFKVRHNDTLKIFGGLEHPQCAAPGYGMYYAWVIRHLPGLAYDAPTFVREHEWMLRDGNDHWWPQDLERDDANER